MTSSDFAKNNLIASAQPQQGQMPGGGPPSGQGGGPAMGQPGGGGGPMMGQPQKGKAQGAAALAPKLAKYAMPSGPVTDNDMPAIKATLAAVCAEISTSTKSAGQKVDDEAIKSGVLGFQDWLKKQKCVDKVTSPYDVNSADKYAAEIFATYPGMLPFHFEFKMAGNVTKPYRLLLFITKVDGFSLASLVENKTINGVPVPKDWPENPWSYWNNRL